MYGNTSSMDGNLDTVNGTKLSSPNVMTSVPISALTSNKLNRQLYDLENMQIFNSNSQVNNPVNNNVMENPNFELQSLQGANQALQNIQAVKLTVINCGDQQTILLTTPSQFNEGVTLSIQDSLLQSEVINSISVNNGTTVSSSTSGSVNSTNNNSVTNNTPTNSLTMVNDLESLASSSKLVNYANLSALPPITSVSDKLCNQQLPVDTSNSHSPNYALQDLKPVIHRNGEIANRVDANGTNTSNTKSVLDLGSFSHHQHPHHSDIMNNSSAPLNVNVPPSESMSHMNFQQDEDMKDIKNFDHDHFRSTIDHHNASPDRSVGDNEGPSSPGTDLEELNTKDLAHKISGELKRYSIPQAVFAQRVLCRSQGTLSDLLRNPKPWSKLKSGRETFRRMWKWLNEPEYQRMSSLRLARRRSELLVKFGEQIGAIKLIKPNGPFFDSCIEQKM